jgi:hypothetical protein
MRIILAVCFIFGILIAVGVSLSTLLPEGPGILGGLIMGVALIAAAVAATVLFNAPGANAFGLRSAEAVLAELERRGLLMTEHYHASRAFSVEEYEDEGSHYFVELTDGRVLYLTGQYLLDYEPIDDSEEAAIRRFPCESFMVRWHRTEGYTVDLVCEGAVFEPEVVLPSFSRRAYREGFVPEDRAIITDRTYTEIRDQIARGV